MHRLIYLILCVKLLIKVCFIFKGKDDEINEDALTPQLIEELSKQVGSMWKRLGLELNFQEDDISYFEKENESTQERALKMLTVWQVCTGFKSIIKQFTAVLFKIIEFIES